jgi:hypothetical protein
LASACALNAARRRGAARAMASQSARLFSVGAAVENALAMFVRP